MKTTIVFLLVSMGIAVGGDPLLPDPRMTPGSITNVPISALLAHGYTASPGIRRVTPKVHRQVFIQYFGKVPEKPGTYEVDHLISLELGGNNSISNLWPQSYVTMPYNSHVKDKLENYMARTLRNTLASQGELAAQTQLSMFQQEIATNWIVAYEKYLGTNSSK